MRRLIVLAGLLLWAQAGHAQIVEYYHLDAQGNVLAVTDSSGTVIEQHDYLPFGEECVTGACSGDTPLGQGDQPKRFTGKERDVETGLDYFGARYYGSRIGRFTTTDPVYNWNENLVDPQRWNRYAYGRNNPLRYADPDGKDVFTQQEVFQAWAEYQRGEITLQQYQAQMNAIGKGGLIVTGIYAGVAAAALAPELLAAAAVKAADPQTQAFAQEFLQEAAGGPPGAPSPMRVGQGIAIGAQSLQHVVEGHTLAGAKNFGKSVFAEGENLVSLIKNAEGTNPVLQSGGRYQRIVDAGRTIGIDRATGKATSTYTVITDKSNKLVTAFPGKP